MKVPDLSENKAYYFAIVTTVFLAVLCLLSCVVQLKMFNKDKVETEGEKR